MRLLRQPQYHPMKQHEQVVLLVAALNHVMQNIPVRQMDVFRRDYLAHMERNAGALCHKIDQSGQLTDSDMRSIVETARSFAESWTAPVAGKGVK